MAKSKKTDDLNQGVSPATINKLPGVLSFQRGMLVTDAPFYNVEETGLTPLHVYRHGIRGTLGVGSESDTAKGNKERKVANIQQTESAKLSPNASAMAIKFGIRMLDLDHVLFACAALDHNRTKVIRASIEDFIRRAKSSLGLEEVCRRYARNIVNAGWAWRNRVMASEITVTVRHQGEIVATFDALKVPLHHFDNYSEGERKVGEILARGCRGDVDATLDITATLKFGLTGQIEVHPSQSYIEKKPSGFARPLYKINPIAIPKSDQDIDGMRVIGQAALRDQKISNRLRCIDTWYKEFNEINRPIPVEPTGANLELMQFFRKEKGESFFGMVTRLKDIDPDSSEGMYSIAMMIRGGVFGESEKEKDDKAKKGGKGSDAAEAADNSAED
jgi:CRISPR-associated protein Csy3